MGLLHSAVRRRPTMPNNSKITIRLPDELAAKLSEVANHHETTRTAILLDLLATGIDTWQPAQSRPTASDADRLDRAIELLQLELAEAIERIDRLERRSDAVQRSPKPQSMTTMIDPPTYSTDTYTSAEVAAIEGIDRSNVGRDAPARGWVKVGRNQWRRA